MSSQLVSWCGDIATVLSPLALVLFLVHRMLRDLLGIITVLRKIGHVVRPAASRRRRRPMSRTKR
jgi:hypothetical protein